MAQIRNINGDSAVISVPSYRATKDISIKEDIVEEIARMYGYDNIVPVSIKTDAVPVAQDKKHVNEYKIKRLLAEKYGFSEVHSYIWNYEDYNNSIGYKTKSYLQKFLSILLLLLLQRLSSKDHLHQNHFHDHNIYVVYNHHISYNKFFS